MIIVGCDTEFASVAMVFLFVSKIERNVYDFRCYKLLPGILIYDRSPSTWEGIYDKKEAQVANVVMGGCQLVHNRQGVGHRVAVAYLDVCS